MEYLLPNMREEIIFNIMTTKDIEICSIYFKLNNGDTLVASTTNAVLLATIAEMCEFVKVDPDFVTVGKLPTKKGDEK